MNEADLIPRLNELPRLKKVLQELLQMINQSEVDFIALSDKMKQDQVLSASLLRMANSSYFGGVRSISSVNEAIIRVGSGPVRTLVVASILSGVFPKLETLDINEYWANTFEISTIASRLATKVGLDASEVFTTSILHNIGELMIHTLIPKEAAAIERRVKDGENRYAIQSTLLSTTSPVLGAHLAKSWYFPDEMSDAILNVNDPSKAKISPKLAATINFARATHIAWDSFTKEDEKVAFINAHPSAKLLNVTGQFAETIDKIRGKGREIASQLT